MDLGKYDLYFMVRDEFNNTAEDPFNQNQDELELISSVTPPAITAGNTKCVPSSVNKIGSGTTKIYCEFSDSNYTSVNDFNVTFKIRDQENNELILVADSGHGSNGTDPDQPGEVEITYSGTVFTAWYEWDPPVNAATGTYDLYFGVKNRAGGYASDKYDENLEELTVVTTGNAPEISDVGCEPDEIPIIGSDFTTITAKFTDVDYPLPGNFTVTIKVRDSNNTEIILVKEQKHTGVGELGGTLSVIKTTDGYNASYTWDPAENVAIGKYDLYVAIVDDTMIETIHGFDENVDELELTPGKEPEKPSLTADTPTNEDNKYTFTITFKDEKNNAPDEDGIRLFIDSVSYKMEEVDTGDTNYTDGKRYTYTIELEEGTYTYYFKVRTAGDELVKTNNQTINVSPKPAEPDDGDDDDDTNYTAIGVGLAILILILIFLFIMMMMRKKKPEREPLPGEFTLPDEEHVEAPAAMPVDHEEGAEPAPTATPAEPVSEEEPPMELPEEVAEEPVSEEGEAPITEEEAPVSGEPPAEEEPAEPAAEEPPEAEEQKPETEVKEEKPEDTEQKSVEETKSEVEEPAKAAEPEPEKKE
jgi:hypothetical protein